MAGSPNHSAHCGETLWSCPSGHRFTEQQAGAHRGVCATCAKHGLANVPLEVTWMCSRRHRVSQQQAEAARFNCPHCKSAGWSDSSRLDLVRVVLAVSAETSGGAGDQAAAEEAPDQLTAQYDLQEKIGEGTYGKVYKATCRRTGEKRAIKRIRILHEEEGVPATALREITMLMDMRGHPNVLRLHDVFPGRGKLNLVFECLDMDLREFLKKNGRLQGSTLRSSALQLVRGLDYCHSRRVLHRDLKPQNVLVELGAAGPGSRPVRPQRLVLADFGLARAFSVPLKVYTHEVVTLWYRPPEILLGQVRYGPSADVWSLGCIISEMATASALFAGDSEIDTIYKIFQVLGTPDDSVWPGVSTLKDWKARFPKWRDTDLRKVREEAGDSLEQSGLDLLRSCLRYNHVKRPSAQALTEHAFFNGLQG